MANSNRFAGKTALITGAGSGIGAAVARRFTADGGHAIVLGRAAEPLQEVAASIGAKATAVVGDAASAKDVQSAIAEANKHGGLDVLVANAGGHLEGDLLKIDDETWQSTVRMNLDTAFVCARECVPELIKKKGSIVFVSSIAGMFAGPHVTGYVTSKHAVIGLARAVARDYAGQGIRANTICPGWTRTELADAMMEMIKEKHGLKDIEEAYALVTKDVPSGRPATADEIAGVICFLASDDASPMNGATVTADGGATIVDLPTLAFV